MIGEYRYRARAFGYFMRNGVAAGEIVCASK